MTCSLTLTRIRSHSFKAFILSPVISLSRDTSLRSIKLRPDSKSLIKKSQNF